MSAAAPFTCSFLIHVVTLECQPITFHFWDCTDSDFLVNSTLYHKYKVTGGMCVKCKKIECSSNFLTKRKNVINFIFTNSYCKTKITSIRMLCTGSFHTHFISILSFSKISKALKTTFQFCCRNVTSEKFKHDTSSLS